VPEPSTLVHIANIVIQRVLAECTDASLLIQALEEAYPFGDLVDGRQIWVDSLLRNGIEHTAATRNPPTSHAVVMNLVPMSEGVSKYEACGASDTPSTTD
jgi:hypothetical protein